MEKEIKLQFELMLKRSQQKIIGDEHSLNLADKDIRNFVGQINEDARIKYAQLHKYNERVNDSSLELWDVVDSTASAHMTTQFLNLYILAQSFMIRGTSFYQQQDILDEIIYGIEYMITIKKYNGSDQWTGNWWDWQIGSGQFFAKTLIILKDYIEADMLHYYTSCIVGYNKTLTRRIGSVNPTTGANRADIGLVVMDTAILLEDEERMDQIRDEIPVMLKYVTTGDGYYQDGSFIQHRKFPYSGNYGTEALKGLAAMSAIVADTKWSFTNSEYYHNLAEIIVKTYLPIIHNGQMMSMVMGRNISRAPGVNRFTSAFSAGGELMANLLVIADSLEDNLAIKIKQHVKYWLIKAEYNYYETSRDLEMLLNLKHLMNDQSIMPIIDETIIIYNDMARVISHDNNVTVGIAMTNKHIANYEYTNTENPFAFHTADGMLYMYNDDSLMFGESYWPTVDFYRLPGTTVDTVELEREALNSNVAQGVSFAGGVVSDKLAAIGFHLDKGSQVGDDEDLSLDLKAYKSYFFIEGKIVLLGSDINGTTSASIETIVENRIINPGTRIFLNGRIVEEEIKTSLNVGDWISIEAQNGKGFHYYFLDVANDVLITRQTRTGTYERLNGYFPSDKNYSEEYLLISVNHGQKVKQHHYEYMILPNTKQNEIDKHSENIIIMECEDGLHAIYDKSLNILMVNNFSDTTHEINTDSSGLNVHHVTINPSTALIAKMENDELVIIEKTFK